MRSDQSLHHPPATALSRAPPAEESMLPPSVSGVFPFLYVFESPEEVSAKSTAKCVSQEEVSCLITAMEIQDGDDFW